MGSRAGCDPGCACAANEFGERDAAQRPEEAIAGPGPVDTTRWLIDAFRAGGVDG